MTLSWLDHDMIDQTRSSLWWKLDGITTWPNVQVWSTSKPKLNCQDLSDQVWSVMKTRQDIDVTDHIDVVYIKNEIELSWLIQQGAVYDEN